MRLFLHLAAPYIAVGLFWCCWPQGWLAILAYHAQIVIGLLRRKEAVKWGADRKNIWLALPSVIAGPAVYYLLPHITRVDVSVWLQAHHVTGWGFILLIPYFGLLHPVLEQLHWAPLRVRSHWAHVLFAGYHVLVLYSLLSLTWLLICFLGLVGVSYWWGWMAKRLKSICVPVLSHMLADFGIILAAWLRV